MDPSHPQQPPPGPPYIPQVALAGGQPSINVDVPITSVFILLFIIGAVCHMTILQINLKRGHKFIMSGLLFGFCMARISASVMRIVWATRPENISIAIAAQVLTAAGVVLLFIINNIFAQRIIRASHPNSGWHPFFHFFFIGLYTLLVISLIMLITVTVISFYTLDTNTRLIARDIQWYGQAYFLFVAFLPIPLIFGSLILPRSTRVEKFGSGRFRTKIAILLFSTALLTLGAGFRAGTAYMPPRPRNDPAWYHSQACFYIFNFGIEIIVVYLYVLVRVDRRFHIPNGSKGPGDYSGTSVLESEKQKSTGESSGGGARIMSEEEVFDDKEHEDVRFEDGRHNQDLERGSA